MATAIDLPPPGFYEDEPSNDDALTPTRVPPHDHDAEKAILAEAMCDPASFERVVSLGLMPEDFESEAHRQWWRGCLELRESGHAVEALSVVSHLARTERLQQVGREYLADTIAQRRFPVRVEAWVELVLKAARARRTLAICQRAEALAYAGSDADAVITGTIEALRGLEPATRPAAPWTELVQAVPANWYTSAPPARDWLLRDSRQAKARGVLPRRKVGQVIGEGGVSKTMAMIELAVSLATGVPWLGAFVPERAGRSLLLLGEEDLEEPQRRLFHARRAMRSAIPAEGSIVTLPLAGVPCAMLERDQDGNLRETVFFAWLRAYVQSSGPWDLIVVDPVSRFGGPECEIDNAAGTRFVQCLEALATMTGAVVLQCHHTNKLSRRGGIADATAGRGSTSLVDGSRWQCSLSAERLEIDDPEVRERLGELVVWTHTKSNYSVKAAPVVLRRDLDNGGALVPLDDHDRQIVDDARNGNATQDRAAQRTAKKRSLLDEDDAAARDLLAAMAGRPVRDVVAALKKRLACGSDRALDAIHRVKPGAS